MRKSFKNKLPSRKYIYALASLFLIGLLVRFVSFSESVYFGYDEARDAFISQAIYLEGDLKIIGPQASAFGAIHHGPLYYYIIGPLFILFRGDPYIVSVVFRIINALGIIGVFAAGALIFGSLVGIISSFIYTFSYEQFIYAIFTGNPSLSNVSWILMFLGVGLLKRLNHKKFGLFLVIFGASLIPQFDMILGYSLLVLLICFICLREQILKISKKWIVIVTFLGFSPLYTYMLAEIKNGFLATKTILGIFSSDTSIVGTGVPEHVLFYQRLLGIFRDNIFDFSLSNRVITILVVGVLVYLVWNFRKRKLSYFLVLIWILSFSLLILARGFMPFYSYAGVGIGMILAFSSILAKIAKKSALMVFVLLALVLTSNISKTLEQAPKSLIVGIKAQPGMRLIDEIEIVGKSYEFSEGNGFTIRTTSMPYRVQTVWAYLYHQYGKKNYGYLPYFETGNVEGFEGELPTPTHGTTCKRILIREPVRGIPTNLILRDIAEENNFSEVLAEEQISGFVVQYRQALAADCHNDISQTN